MIAIIDYGLGNVQAFLNVYEKLNIPVLIAKNTGDLKDVSKIILPGVGSFDQAITKINNSGLRDSVEKLVLNDSIPILGICVGMQILAQCSEEGNLAGLGWIEGKVKKINNRDLNSKIPLPHMGWNSIAPDKKNTILANFTNKSRFYFLHSYYFQCKNEKDTIAYTEYGIRFCSAVNRDNIYGVQFHPEKSHQWGIKLLKNFAKL